MSQDATAGRLYLEVVADASGLPADLREKIKVAAARAKAEIRVGLDAARAEAELEKLAGKKRVAAVKAEADTAAAQARLDATAARTRIAKIRAEADTAAAQAKLDAVAAKRRVAEIRVEAQTARAEAQLAAATRKREVSVNLNLRGLASAGTGLASLSSIPALAGGIGILVSTIGNLAAGLVAVAAAGSQAAGVLGALPNLAGVAAQGIGALLIGVSGIGDALKQTEAAEQTAAAATGAASRARVQAAQRIADANRALQRAQLDADRTSIDGAQAVAEARRRLGEIMSDGARRVTDADQDLTRAQLEARAAQSSLNDARAEARRRLDDLALSLKGASLNEEDASLAVDRARQRLEQVNSSITSTGMDRREADLAYRQALQRLEEARRNSTHLKEEYTEASRAGVEGSREVQTAQERIRDAQERVADAERQLADARTQSARQVADAQRDLSRALQDQARGNYDAQQRVADAIRNVAEAQRDAAAQTGAQATANARLQTILSRLSPAGREFVTFLRREVLPALRDVRNDVQSALLPPLQRAITAALPLLDTLSDGLEDSARRIGFLAEQGAALVASPMFRGDVATIMASNNRALTDFGDAGLSAVSIMTDLAVAAGPLVERFARWVSNLFESVEGMVQANRESGKLQAFFDRAGDKAAQLGRIMGNVARAVLGVFRAAMPAGNDLLDTIESVTRRWANFANSTRGQNTLGAAFEAAVPVLESVGGLLLALLRTVGLLAGGGEGGGLAAFFDTLTGAVNLLNRALENPAVAAFANQLLILAGIGGAVGFLVGKVLALAGALRFILPILGGIPKVLSGIVAGVRVLGAAFLASGPWGWAIAAVIAIGVALFAAYKHFSGFRDLVNKVVRSVGDAFIWLWEEGIQPAWNGLVGIVRDHVIPVLQELWGQVVQPIFRDMGRIIRGVWLDSIKPTLAAFGDFLREDVGPAIRWIWRNVVQPAFVGMGVVISWWWNNVVKNVFRAWHLMITEVVAPIVMWLWRNVVRPGFEGMALAIRVAFTVIRTVFGWWRDGMRAVAAVVLWLAGRVRDYFRGMGILIRWVWDNVIKKAFDLLRAGVYTVRDAFGLAIDGIKRIWNGLKKIASDPVKFVIDTVYNNGIRAVWNKVAGLVGLKPLDPMQVPRGFARGGVVPGGYEPGIDSVDAKLSKGEGILVPEAVRGLARMLGTTAVNAIDLINSSFSSRVPRPGGMNPARGGGFAFGGVFDYLGDRAKDVGSWVSEGLESVGSAVSGFALGALRSGAERALAPIRGLIGRVLPATVGFPNLLNRGANTLIDALLGKVGREDSGMLAGGGFGRGGEWPRGIAGRIAANTAAAAAYIRDTWPQIRSIGTLGSRPNKSDHPMGKALDAMVPGWSSPGGKALGNAIASWFVQNASTFGTKYVIWRDQINSGGGWRPYVHPNGRTNNPTLQHRDHVHVSFLNKGGVAGLTPLVRDFGGRIPPGLSAVNNTTGLDEWMFNDRQVRQLAALAGAGARATSAAVPAGSSALAGEVRRLVDAVRASSGVTIPIYAQQQDVNELARAVAVELEWQRRG